MRITIAEYAKWARVSIQAVTWRLRKNAQDNEPLNNKLPEVKAVRKLGRSYELDFDGIYVPHTIGKKVTKSLKSKSELTLL